VLVAAAGLAATALGWLAIAAGQIEPEATLFAAQPGGVIGEMAVGALVGAAAGAWLLKRATKRVIGAGARKR
jgi:apolipoprotein N-acyltransferase